MAAPLGFKTFVTGEVLTAADTNGYLMQGIWTFNNAAARDAAVTAPVEGNTCYLKDTDVIQVYSGSAWVTKSGSSPLTTKGDIYTYSTTDARLGVGTNGQLLSADSTAATGLAWVAAPSGGGMTSLASGSLSGTSVTISSINQTYNSLILRILNPQVSATAAALLVRVNNVATASQQNSYLNSSGTAINNTTTATGYRANALTVSTTVSNSSAEYYFPMYTSSNTGKMAQILTSIDSDDSRLGMAYYNLNTTAITSLVITASGSTFNAGTYVLYGVK